MHNLGVDPILGHRQRPRERVDRAREPRIAAGLGLVPLGITANDEGTVVYRLIAERADFDLYEFGQRAAEIFDMHACPAVDVGWVFLAEHGDFGKHGQTSSPT